MSKARPAVPDSGLLIAALLFAISLAACSSDKIVYRDRQPFNTPPAAAVGFLGYYDSATKQTTCGNCHADLQASWAQTKHAGAYKTLTASGHATAACFSCHSVSGNGNKAVGTVAGHDAVQLATYNDVQC